MKTILIYGSYGYTGRLITEECRKQNLNVILSGRNAAQLAEQSRQTGYPFEVCEINDSKALRHLLSKTSVVIHCAGPFRHTAREMVKACLDTGVHYTDITGEYDVFEQLAQLHDEATKRNIMIMPGTGFDVVPSDCLAVHLKNKLPDATHLQLAFTALKGGISRGTRKSMIEGVGHPGKVRKDGKLVDVWPGDKTMEVDFGAFRQMTMCIPWGDVSTAWFSTGIPNIEIYAGVSPKIIKWARLSRYLNSLLRMRIVKSYLLRQADKKAGPAAERIREGKSYLWGKVWNDHGLTVEARLETLNGYVLTAKTSVLVASKIINQNFKAGFQTPAMAYGKDLIMEVEGTQRN
ncbi:MAG: saccharopine dehydrogenase NADP-binding domain-containing protein [Cyclobacteriaceae bacterium]|nr:saccharopine dehydrogenase NADP-binding domain-containing protein [Cyclobacteriaceae bacterium]